MVEGTVESKLATISPHAPACKYRKSTSGMPASAAESLGLAAAPTRSFTLPGDGKAHAAV
jgi:hypothetical protein